MTELPYRISAPARRAARVLMQNFDIIERPGCDTEPCEENIATIIDAYSQAFRMKEAMKYLSSRANWLDDQEAGVYLEDRVEELREAVDAIDEFRKSLPRFSDESEEQLHAIGLENRQTSGERAETQRRARRIEVNPLALHATRMLMEHFFFVERVGGVVRSNERHIALIIGYATRIERLQEEFNLLCSKVSPMSEDEIRRDLRGLNRTVDMLGIREDPRLINIRGSLRRTELAHNYMPGYGNEMPRNLRRVPMGGQWAKNKYEPTDQEKRRAAQIAEILATCRTPDDIARVRQMLGEVA